MKRKNINIEQGITLISLIISIVIIVILVAVTIKTITGDDPIIGTAVETVEDHKIVSYKEQIEQTIQGTVIAKSAAGELTTTGEIEGTLKDESWVKVTILNSTATADAGDITIQTEGGYVYQTYYNNIYGYVDIEYIGKNLELSKKLSITARYEKTIAGILSESEDRDGKVIKQDLIHKQEIRKTIENPNGEQRYKISDIGTGWYKVRATAESGATKFAWVRATNTKDALSKPTIEIETKGKAENGWYGADKKDLWIKISTTSPSAKTIHYALSGAHTEAEKTEEVNGTGEKSIRFQITETGLTNIVAWTEDETEKYQSEETRESVKFDDKPPEVTEIEEKGTAGENGWYTSDIELTTKAEDLNGKPKTEENNGQATLNGYNYTLLNKDGNELKAKTHIPSMETTISTTYLAKEDGIYIFHITANDQAGNESSTKVTTIQKDTTPPTISTPSITNETETGFTITVEAEDQTSGIKEYEYYLNGSLAKTSIESTWTVEGLTPNQVYNITVKARDNAGLTSLASNNVPVMTKGELLPPEIDIAGKTRNGYYIGDVTITVRDTSEEGKTRASKIKVQGAGGERTINATTGNFTITTDGTYNLSAWSEDNSGGKSSATTKPEFKRDATPPRPTLGTPETDPSGTIKVTATANETGGSGVASYEFQYKEVGGNWTRKEVINSTASNYEYTYGGMGDGKTVYIRVLVKDVAGHEGKSAEDSSNGTEAIIPNANTAPRVRIVGTPSKTTNQISVVANADDDQGDSLKYTLYTSTNGTNWTAGTTSNSTKAGTNVSLNSATLAQYTYYYIKVVAIETTQNPNLSGEAQYASQIRTYCPGPTRSSTKMYTLFWNRTLLYNWS